MKKRSLRILTGLLLLVFLLTVISCNASGKEDGTANTDSGQPEPTIESTEEGFPSDDLPEDEWERVREKAKTGKGIKVLFIGNSLTYYNKMPNLFCDLSTLADKMVTVDSLTYAGQNLVMMREDPNMWRAIEDKITSTNWDIVVFQTDRIYTVMTEYYPDYPLKTCRASEEIVAMIKDAGALPVIYSAFGVNRGYMDVDGHTKNISAIEINNLVISYDAAISQKTGCKTVYTNATFSNLLTSHPELGLYHTDNRHPSAVGSALIACDFYTVIFGESPETISFKGVDLNTADVLRNASAMLLTYIPRSIATIEEIDQ